MMSDGTVAMSYVIKDDAERLENTQASICNPGVTEGSCTQLTFKKVQLFRAVTASLQILRSSLVNGGASFRASVCVFVRTVLHCRIFRFDSIEMFSLGWPNGSPQ